MKPLIGTAISLAFLVGCSTAMSSPSGGGKITFTPTTFKASSTHQLETAGFAGGCFWGTEYRFRKVKGVTGTAVGYAGGHKDSPTYEDVCTHTTGHAETALLKFDPQVVSYRKLLDLFLLEIHNPTEEDRQGPDEGDSYRSVIFYSNEQQHQEALAAVAAAQKVVKDKIVTQIVPLKKFWMAEEYHQNYCERTGHLACPVDPIIKIGK